MMKILEVSVENRIFSHEKPHILNVNNAVYLTEKWENSSENECFPTLTIDVILLSAYQELTSTYYMI